MTALPIVHPDPAEPPTALRGGSQDAPGHFPIHCPTCGTTWYRIGFEHCVSPNCHKLFASTKAGDKHLVGRGKDEHCLSTEEMVNVRNQNTGLPWFEYIVVGKAIVWRERKG